MRSLILVLFAISIAGCGGVTTTAESSSGAAGGAGVDVGSAGAAGSATSGGSGGGAAGIGVSGSGGGAIADASAGTGGAPVGSDGGVKPECTSEKDCKIFTDCCVCEGVPTTETPASCHSICQQNQCASLGVVTPQAACIAGRCVVGFECDSSKVLCKSVPPMCPPGQVPLVAGACWQGGCVPANECASVKDCNACTGDLICAEFPQRGGTLARCYDVPQSCNGDYGCSCAGAAICSGPGLSCVDLSGLKGIACSCPAC